MTSGAVVCYTYAIAAVAQFWLEHSPVTREAAGSSPVRSAERIAVLVTDTLLRMRILCIITVYEP